MGRTNLNILLIATVGLTVIASGCTGGQDVTSVVKALPEVQQFMKEHPNAKITVTYWSKEEVAKSTQEINQLCDKPITPVAMYKATVSEGDLKIVSWINAENQIVVCSVTQGSGITSTPTPIQTTVKPTPTPTPIPTPVATATIGENIAVEAVDGNKATGSSTTLLNLNVTIKIQAGGSDIDLSKVLVKVNAQNYNYSANVTSQPANTFVVYSLRDPGSTDLSSSGINSFSGKSNPTLKSGALARIDVNISSLSIGARNDITLALTPEKGATVNLPLTTPALGSTTSVAIYP